MSGFSGPPDAGNGQIFRGYKYPLLPPQDVLIPSFKTTIVRATKFTRSPPLNPPKLLIFGEPKKEALIYILTEAIYFPLSFD
jgi:hypothetical protein